MGSSPSDYGVQSLEQAFEGLQIIEVEIPTVGSSVMWNVALGFLPEDEGDRENPLVVRVTDRLGNQIEITRISGVPVLVGAKNVPQRYSQSAIEFQTRWNATPANLQSIVRKEK